MDISIVIPANNEQENLPSLIDNLLKLKNRKWKYEIIIVNDNSKDNTQKIADYCQKKYKNIRVLHRVKGNNGMGISLKEGTSIAKGNAIIWVMGDNSDDLATIPKIIDKINHGYDVVFGSRYVKGGSRGNLKLDKAVLSSGYTIACRLLFGIRVHDITNAFRGFKKEVFNKIKISSNNFAISPEFAIKAHLAGFKLGEVPTTYKDRKKGKTKFQMLKMGIEYMKLFKYRFTL